MTDSEERGSGKKENQASPEYMYIDTDRFEHVTVNDTELKQLLIQKYIEVTHRWGEDLYNAMENGDILRMRKVLHQMKPHLTMIGSEKLEKMVDELHGFCHIGESKMKDIRLFTTEVRDVMPVMRNELTEELDKFAE